MLIYFFSKNLNECLLYIYQIPPYIIRYISIYTHNLLGIVIITFLIFYNILFNAIICYNYIGTIKIINCILSFKNKTKFHKYRGLILTRRSAVQF